MYPVVAETRQPALESTDWFGRPSFVAASIVMVLNVVPTLIYFYFAALAVLLAPFVLVTGVVALFAPGFWRQVGVGALLGLLGSTATIATYFVLIVNLN
ncbi:hypothetical protein [Nocardia sp. NBC_00511]|uniref:hypothetical protein n=1 Tax=Nocardia sp. NBC_00511 TaxID=2903591 RepID=UPI0030DF7B11